VQDLRLYNPTGIYAEKDLGGGEQMRLVMPEDPTATSIEVIAGKVVKFLLTARGSDAFNPTYGGVSLHHVQISQAYIPQLTFEVHSDVEACTAFIKDMEKNYAVRGERLSHINVRDIRYDPRLTPYRIDVYLEIVTTLGKRAVVAITNQTGR